MLRYTDVMNILRIVIMVIATVVFFGLPTWNLARLKGNKHVLWGVVPIILLISSFAFSQIFESSQMVVLYMVVKQLAYYILIIGMMLFAMSVFWMLFGHAFRLKNKTIFWLIIISTLVYISVGMINGQRIVVKDLTLPAENISRQYDFVHITDLHSGSTDRAHAQRVVNKIKPLGAEFVVITGDFIDEFYVSEYDIEPFNSLDIPIFLITGNHEYYLDEGKINEVIQNTDILLIDGMKIGFEELDIIGVSELSTVDYTIEGVGGIDENRYSIILDHQPKTDEAHRAAENGAELMLSGHTHKGQVWPMNWLVRLQFMYISGLYEIGDMFLYVNQGTGTLGPKIRVNSVNEITYIHLKPIQ